MKTNYLILWAWVLAISACNTRKEHSDTEESVVEKRYFGQDPPGLVAEIFAPGVVSVDGRQEGGVTFSPTLDEMYFSAGEKEGNHAIYFSKRIGGKWTPIEKANFTKGGKDGEMHPYVNFEGDRIYFTAYSSDLSDTRVWYVNRTGDSWSDAIKLDLPIGQDLAFYANQARNGDLFYTNISKLKMNYSPIKNGEFPEAEELQIEFGFHGFISPSQDYMVVNFRHQEDETRKDHDIYVYFKRNDGSWTEAINLGTSVNTNLDENTPGISHDGRYLFFGRRNEDGGTLDIFWVSTKVIDDLRHVL